MIFISLGEDISRDNEGKHIHARRHQYTRIQTRARTPAPTHTHARMHPQTHALKIYIIENVW